MRRLAILVVLGSLFAVLSVEAQVVTGTMIGTVRDESGAVLPGVTVTATSPARPAGPVTVVTNEQGAYRISELPPGVYELRVELPSFRVYVEQDLRVTVGGTVERNVSLAVAAVAETITVSGQGPVVDPRQTGVIRTLPRDALESIPIARSALNGYMATMPGVALSGYGYSTGKMYVMGSERSETSYMIDGMWTNRPSSFAPYHWHDVDAVEEVSLIALGASTEYQLAQGGVMNVVTKSGTNVFRGDAQYYWAPSGLTTAPIKLPCACPLGDTGFKLYKLEDWSAHVGGRILRDRLWFHTGLMNTNPLSRNPGLPDRPKEQWGSERDLRSMSKVTWKVNEKIQYQQNLSYEYWNFSSFPTIVNPFETLQHYGGEGRYLGSEVTATLTSSTVLTVRYLRHSSPLWRVGMGPNLKHDSESQKVPGRLDTFTGVSRDNATAFPTGTEDPIRDDMNVKLNRYVSGARVTQNIGFGVQISRARDQGPTIWPGDVLYLDFKGAPNEARFEPPSTYAAAYQSQGVWFEDEINIGGLTIVPGIRFDRMRGYSPPAPVYDPLGIERGGVCRCGSKVRKTGAEIPGLGDLFTWKKVSPRVGINLRLTSDGRTVLRATAGRYYRPIFLNDFTGVHPGRALITLRRYDPATRDYTTLISVTDPRANIGVDTNMDAPYNDQYSIGLESQVANNLAVSITYVRKTAGDLIGWRDAGGIYGEQTVIAPNGQALTVFPLLNSPSARKFLRANGPGFYNRYNGLMLGMTRRLANRWMVNANYTYSNVKGLDYPPGSGTFATTAGQDPNDLVNYDGPLAIDRPHMLGIAGAYEIPKIEVQFSANLSVVSGNPYGPQIQVSLPQGRRNIYFEPPGSYRTPTEKNLIFRASKILLRREARRIEVGVELRNALEQTLDSRIVTTIFASPNFGRQGRYPIPRQLVFRARAFF